MRNVRWITRSKIYCKYSESSEVMPSSPSLTPKAHPSGGFHYVEHTRVGSTDIFFLASPFCQYGSTLRTKYFIGHWWTIAVTTIDTFYQGLGYLHYVLIQWDHSFSKWKTTPFCPQESLNCVGIMAKKISLGIESTPPPTVSIGLTLSLRW